MVRIRIHPRVPATRFVVLNRRVKNGDVTISANFFSHKTSAGFEKHLFCHYWLVLLGLYRY